MRHPDEATLALHAGGDLGPWSRWRVARHLAHCGTCREEVAAFDDMRQVLPELAEIPEISWNRLAAEIKANVRLGLAAGECVRMPEPALRESPWFTGGRWLVAAASILVLIATGMVLEHPAPIVAHAAGSMVESTGYGVQSQAGGQMFALTNGGAQKVTYTMDAQGSMGARYVDPATGYLTINTVYVQ